MSAFYEMSEMTSSEFRDAARTIEIALVPAQRSSMAPTWRWRRTMWWHTA
jgi:hypothetical protein